MPRRRYWGGANPNRTVPKPIKVTAAPLPIDGLRKAYDWYLFDKTFGLRMALEWFAANYKTLLFQDPLDADRQRSYDRAAKSKNLGDSSPEAGERETAWTRAVQLYGKVWSKKGLPDFSETERKAAAGEQPSKDVLSVRTVLANLNGAFAGMGVSFAPTLEADRHAGSDNAILIPVAELEAMVTVAPLKTALVEAPNVAKVASIVWVGGDALTGVAPHQELDGEKFFENLPLALERVYDWAAATSGGSLTKPVGKAVKNGKTPKTPRQPRTAGTGGGSKEMSFRDTQVITILQPGNPFSGNLAIRYALIVDGMTVRAFKLARKAAGQGTGCYPIEAGIKRGLLAVN